MKELVTKSQAKRIKAQTTVKAWAVVSKVGEVELSDAKLMVYPVRKHARMDAYKNHGERVVRCEIRLLK